MGGRSSSEARLRPPWLVTLGTEQPGGRWRLTFFALADDPRVYAYVAATYLSEIFTVDHVR